MAKPDISIHFEFLEKVAGQERFQNVETHESDLNHIHFPGIHETAIFIHIFNLEADPIDRTETIDRINNLIAESDYLQKYIIFDTEYPWVRKELNVYNLFRDQKTKIVFTNSLRAAVNYGVNLLEKAAKYGIYS